MQIPRDHIIIGLIALTLVFVLAGGFMVLYVMLYNTRKKKHLLEKENMNEQFTRELAMTRMEVQEQMLKTIASDIHDNVGQMLSITKITLSAINLDETHEKARERLNGAIGLLDNSIKELRQLASILHAPNLLSAGLEKAVENELNWLARTDRFKIQWSVSGTDANRLDPQKQLIAFRIVQELLNNIIKHAEATILNVEMQYLTENVSIAISDNGKGFDVAGAVEDKKGLGIGNFFTRAIVIGGRLDLISSADQGTRATLQIPYS